MRQMLIYLMPITQQTTCQILTTLLFFFVVSVVTAGRVFVLDLLFLAGFDAQLTAAMPLRERVEGFHFAVFGSQFSLAVGGAELGLGNHRLGLHDGVVKASEERLIVAPGIAAYPDLGGGDKAFIVFVPVLLKQDQACAGFLLPGQQFSQPLGGLVHAKL